MTGSFVAALVVSLSNHELVLPPSLKLQRTAIARSAEAGPQAQDERRPIGVAVSARHVQPGELVVMTIVPKPAAAHVRVRAFDRDLAPFAIDGNRWRVLVGIDLDVALGVHGVRIDADTAHTTYELTVAPRTFRTRRLTVDEAFVTPPPSVEERIAREARLLNETWRSSAGERLWRDGFVAPVPDQANSAFGTRSIFNGKPRNRHAGADFLSAAGTPIHAPNAGRVVIARDLYYSGKTVVIDHGLGLFSLLAHLSAFEVAEGDQVTTDQVVGLVGATGRVTGAHLHWAVRAGAARVDPISLLAVLGERGPTVKK